MFRVDVKHDRYHHMPDDPVKLGVVLGWVVDTGMLTRFREMRSREKKAKLEGVQEVGTMPKLGVGRLGDTRKVQNS